MNKQLEDIKAIRDMMERSSKFLSLSGMSGIFAGATAIAGAAFAWFYLLRDPAATDFSSRQELLILSADALVVLLVAIGGGVYFSWKKARKSGRPMLDATGKRTLYNLCIPLVAGGIFALIFLLRGDIYTVIAATLIFYGLALVNVSKYTYDEVHYLGLTEIVLGLLSAFFMRYGMLFWTIGFGLCHILYGGMMYVKYDRNRE